MAQTFTSFTPVEEAQAAPPAKFTSFTPLEASVAPTKVASFSPIVPAPEPQEFLGSPMGDDFSSAIMAASAQPKPIKKQSVLEGIDIPELKFDPEEAKRLSRREYAQEQGRKFDPRYQQKMTQGGPRKPPSAAELSGGMMQNANPLARVGQKALQSGAEGVGGVLRAVGDVVGSDTVAGTGEYMAKNAREYQQAMGPAITGDIQGFGPKSFVPDLLKYSADMGEGAASSLAQSIAASSLGPAAVIPTLSVMSAGGQYNKARDAGKSTLDALTNAVPYGIFEAVGEKFAGLDKVAGAMKALVNNGASDVVKKQAGDTLLKMGVREIPGEVITYLGQTGVDLLPGIGLNPNLTMAEFLDGLRDTVVQAGMMGGAVAGVGKYLQGTTPQKTQSAEQMARERGFLISEPKAKPPAAPIAPTGERIEPTFEPEKFEAQPPVTDKRQALKDALADKIRALAGPSAEETNAPTQEGAKDVTKPISQTGGKGVAIPPQPADNVPPAEGVGGVERDGVVPTGQDVTKPAAGEGTQPVAVTAEEDYANKSLKELENLRSTADQTNDALDIASVKKHFGPDVATAYENMSRRERNRWWNENATEALDRDASTFNGVNEDLLDEYIKAHNNFDTESPNSLGRSVGLLARKIKDPRFVGSPEFVTLKNALAYAKQQGFSEAEVLGGMRERASEWAGADAQELFKDLFKAKPTQVNAPKLEPVATDEEYIPFYGEDLTNKPMPDRLEVQELLTQAEEASKAAEQLSKRTAGTSLIKVLQGSLKDSEMSELGGRSRQVGKNPFMSLVAKKGKPGSSMEDMVDSGALDLFLPEKMRPGHPMYDNYESAAYIREKLIQGQYYTNDTQMEIDRVTEGIWDLDKLINEELSIDDINKEIQLAFDEQREANFDATQAAPEGEARGAAKGEGAKAESDFLKAQTAEELKAKQDEIDRLTKENERLAKEAERKAKADEEAGDFTLTGSDRKADQAAARGQTSFLDISTGPVVNEEKKRNPSLKRKLDKLNRDREGGKITDEAFIEGVDGALEAADNARMYAQRPPRTRGADFIRQRLLEAKRRGDLSEEAVDFAEWFIQRNPQLVDDLGVSIRASKQDGVSGQYFDFGRLMVLMKKSGKDTTTVHEILHHLERMMPPDMQNAIRKAWSQEFGKATQRTTNKAQKDFFKLLGKYHWHGEGREVDFDKAVQMVKDGQVPFEFYQYVNPSEFWAVNGTDIMSGRFNAVRGGVLARMKNWLKELVQKIKSMVGMGSTGDLIKALDSLSKGDGKFQSKEMLGESSTYASVGEPNEPTPEEKEKSTWIFGRDRLGRVGFGPGAIAYRTIADIANKVLDKLALKPISPKLSRAMKNMKAKVELAKNKVAEVASEMNTLSPEEREMISDVIEGELKAGVHPPQHILNIAAAIQSMMSRQSKELVDLGMLSKEAANRWENKYLPRFYERQLKDSVNAWSKAAREVFMKQPLMRGIRGSNLRNRGINEVVSVDDLPNWLSEGWEQRDPKFDPKKSVDTVVWRDYTREERDNMGEIRDAMFRFVMGYNASQRDIALGRLYKDLAKNYASPHPLDGYVHVPTGNAEGTGAARYGALEGMYVPKEIMDHLSANDHAMAEGVLKIYRAGLSKWKEGKTVLNPVAHGNNVMNNFTMAHFAGVSYWDAHKYAGAIKDLAKNDSEMVKEAKEVGLFGSTFSQAELIKSMPPELRAMANLTESALSRFGERIWDTLALTVEVGGKKYGARPVMQWAYENEDLFFRYLIYRDARNRGMEPEDARDYSQEFIFTYDDLPKGARFLRDLALPFFSYTYKIVPVLARTALQYPWRFAAPATVAYTANAMMYAIAANLGGDDDDWLGKVLYKYITDEEFRKKAKDLEANERRNLPEWMKGSSQILQMPKAIRMGMDEVTKLPLFLDISRIFPGADLLDANNNAGGVAMIQPLVVGNPIITTVLAMTGNKDLFFGKDVTKKTDTDAEKDEKRGEWLWNQFTPAIAVGNYHFDRAMSTIANMTGKPITVDAGPFGVIDYTGVGKDKLPVQPKYSMLQTMGIKIRPYDLEMGEVFDKNKKRALIRDLNFEIKKINRQEAENIKSPEAAEIERQKLKEKKSNIKQGLTLSGEEKK